MDAEAAAAGDAGANRIQKTLLVDLDKPGETKELWSTDSRDRFADRGTPLQRTAADG